MNVQTEPTVDPVVIGTQVHEMLVCSFVFDYSGCEAVQNKFQVTLQTEHKRYILITVRDEENRISNTYFRELCFLAKHQFGWYFSKSIKHVIVKKVCNKINLSSNVYYIDAVLFETF